MTRDHSTVVALSDLLKRSRNVVAETSGRVDEMLRTASRSL